MQLKDKKLNVRFKYFFLCVYREPNEAKSQVKNSLSNVLPQLSSHIQLERTQLFLGAHSLVLFPTI